MSTSFTPGKPIPHLVHVSTSGGILTEESLIRLRDNPKNDPTFHYQTYSVDRDRITETEFDENVSSFWNWATETWDEIAGRKEELNISELRNKWFIPFFKRLGYNPEYQRANETFEEIVPDKKISIHISHRGWNSENAPRIHTLLPGDSFDTPTETDRNDASPHDALQDFLKFNEEIDWSFLFNGEAIRLLRTYYHEYTRGYVAFDLENILEDRDLSEFRLMYMVLHASRYISKDEEPAPIDEFFQVSRSTGVKIGDRLRDRVKEAIELLGNDLLSEEKRKNYEETPETVEPFYEELLRTFYRIMFILYAEQRGMLPGSGTLYSREYSITKLRGMAEEPIKADADVDLWRGLQKTFHLVQNGTDPLDIAAYNGDLFDPEKTQLVNDLPCRNDTLLHIIRLLTTIEQEGVLHRISYIDIDVEEIGSIYESLLDYKPVIPSKPRIIGETSYPAHRFILLPQGLERKTTGSYYTDKRLVNLLIKTALVPVVENKLKEIENQYKKNDSAECKQKKIEALLGLNVCDPACGGGTFLIAALDYLGKRLARLETDFPEPAEDELREARRTVLQHCIYGVDKNPLAVELAKISLWLHAFVKDKPLNFLDHKIKCGDSLIGARPYALEDGIPQDAFQALRGQKSTGIPPENRDKVNQLRKITRKTKRNLPRGETIIDLLQTPEYRKYIKNYSSLEEIPEKSPKQVDEKADYYQKILANEEFRHQKKVYDTWTAAFFYPTDFRAKTVPTEPQFRQVVHGRGNNLLSEKVTKLSEKHRFFHWNLEFPHVFNDSKNGFDCILTNPPWEVLQLKENEFFTGRAQEIEEAGKQSERRNKIKNLLNGTEREKALHKEYVQAWYSLKKTDNYLRSSGMFDLSAQGTLNTYAVFVERCWDLLSPIGRAGMVVPTGIATGYYMQDLFASLVEEKSLLSLFDFINRKKLFPIDSRVRFSLFTIGGKNIGIPCIPMSFYNLDPDEVEDELKVIPSEPKKIQKAVSQLPSDEKLFAFTPEDFKTLNPNTLTCPIFEKRKDAELTNYLYQQAPILIQKNRVTDKIESNPWKINFHTLFHMSNDSDLFYRMNQLEELGAIPINQSNLGGVWATNNELYLPLYEGKMIWYYDHRYNSVAETSGQQGIGDKTTLKQHKDPSYLPLPRFWVKKSKVDKRIPNNYNKDWLIGFRNITNSTNERTFIISIIPKTGVGHSMPLIFSNIKNRKIALLIANLSSIVFDYLTRQKLGGNTNMTYYNVEQFPVFPPESYPDNILNLIIPKAIELIYTSYDLKPFALDCGFDCEPFEWDEERRAKLKAELDAIFAYLYDVSREDLEYILSQFPVLRRNEVDEFGEFRKKRLVLEAYDRLGSVMEEILDE